MKKPFTIVELVSDDENAAYGVQAVSFVPEPAIETNFEYYAKVKPPFWKWVADPPVIDTTRDFCYKHAYGAKNDKGDRIYHTDEIKKWATEDDGTFIPGVTMFANFSDDATTFNGDEQIYNCRHRLERVTSLDEVPEKVLRRVANKNMSYQAEEMFFNFEIANEKKKQVKGLVLQSHQLIYRPDADGFGNPGFNYMTRETLKKLKDRYGYNRKITFCHREDITGNAILLDSWLEDYVEDANDEPTRLQWYLKYQIVGDALWAQIETGKVKGFSVEMLMKYKKKD